MTKVCLIFPHQLFRDHPFAGEKMPVILVEEFLFFRQYRFHKAKLIFHRASMKAYEEWLKDHGKTVRYIGSNDKLSDCRELAAALASEGVKELFVADVADDWLRRRLSASCQRHGIRLKEGGTPNFMTSVPEAKQFFSSKKRFFQNDFYIWQRKSRKLLLDAGGKPVGGQWNYDGDNRKKFPAKAVAPTLDLPASNAYIREAQQYVETNFPGAYGNGEGPYLFAVTFAEADRWLGHFIHTRLELFGPYEDAMSSRYPFLFHSVLSPMLNAGLLDPAAVIEKVIEAGRLQNIALSSIEGFIRQVVGWREYIRILYELQGRFQRTRNYWGFSRKIPESFWKGETGIGPVDQTIQKLLRYGYCHHIERLMVLGSFMLLCEFDPDDVYRWFMELFIDAYDWVMVPNVYGMTQFADGGLMTTKPYISGSNYLLKMGDFKRGAWEEVWDGLFWRFLHVHRPYFEANPRLGMLLLTWDKMPAGKKQAHLAKAEAFLSTLDRSGS